MWAAAYGKNDSVKLLLQILCVLLDPDQGADRDFGVLGQ